MRIVNIVWLAKKEAHVTMVILLLKFSIKFSILQFVIFKPLSYSFKETIGFDVKASFTSRPVSRLISWYNKQVI